MMGDGLTWDVCRLSRLLTLIAQRRKGLMRLIGSTWRRWREFLLRGVIGDFQSHYVNGYIMTPKIYRQDKSQYMHTNTRRSQSTKSDTPRPSKPLPPRRQPCKQCDNSNNSNRSRSIIHRLMRDGVRRGKVERNCCEEQEQ